MTGGDEDYTWIYPEIAIRDSYNQAKHFEQSFSVNLSQPTDFPTDGKVIIKVKDGQDNFNEVEIELIAPGIVVEEIYTKGNDAIAVGSTEEIYLQLNAIGDVEDIRDIQARLLKGSCDDEESCANKKVFNITQESLTKSGSLATNNLLYNLKVFIPDYAELTDGDYTYEVTIFDQFNQQTKAYLSAYIGTFADGDINGDQSIDILDIVKTVMYYLNPDQIPLEREVAAIDSNGNRQIDLVDVIKVIQEAMKE